MHDRQVQHNPPPPQDGTVPGLLPRKKGRSMQDEPAPLVVPHHVPPRIHVEVPQAVRKTGVYRRRCQHEAKRCSRYSPPESAENSEFEAGVAGAASRAAETGRTRETRPPKAPYYPKSGQMGGNISAFPEHAMNVVLAFIFRFLFIKLVM